MARIKSIARYEGFIQRQNAEVNEVLDPIEVSRIKVGATDVQIGDVVYYAKGCQMLVERVSKHFGNLHFHGHETTLGVHEVKVKCHKTDTITILRSHDVIAQVAATEPVKPFQSLIGQKITTHLFGRAIQLTVNAIGEFTDKDPDAGLHQATLVISAGSSNYILNEMGTVWNAEGNKKIGVGPVNFNHPQE